MVTKNVSISLKKDGKLVRVGVLLKGHRFKGIEDYGNWYKVNFGNEIGFVWKDGTKPVEQKKIIFSLYRQVDILKLKSNKIKGNLIFLIETSVYNSMTDFRPIAKIKAAQQLHFLKKINKDWYLLEFAGRKGYVKSRNVLEQGKIKFKIQHNPYINIIRKYLVISPLNQNSKKVNDNGMIKAANLILNDKIKFPKYNNGIPMNYRDGIDWTKGSGVDNEHQRSFLRQLHGLFFINDLAKAYYLSEEETLRRKYINKGFEIIKDWKINNPYHNPKHSMAWHDEGTARRLTTLVNFFEAGKEVLTNEQKIELFKLMIFHADLLMDDSFYSKNTNHGMFQDASLIVFSKYFYDFKPFSNYYNLAVKRLNNYFDTLISEDGVHLEHSPSYHQTTAGSIRAYGNTLNEFGDSDMANIFLNKYNKMANYAIHVIKPDGKWPLIADTYASDKVLYNFWVDNPYYRYAVTSGKQGKQPITTNAVFPDADYAIFRDSWSNNGTYIFFTAAYHTNYHKHSDDLSLWIYNNEDIIIEAGPHSYTLSNPVTKYAYSSFAHNTLIVDDKGLPRVDEKVNHTYIKEYNLENKQLPTVTGVNERYDGVIHERKVTYDKDDEVITVIDGVSSDTTYNYKLLWHLAPNIMPSIDYNKNEITLKKNGNTMMVIQVNSDVELTISNVYGDENEVFKSWTFDNTRDGVIIDVHTLIIEVEASKAELNTSFIIY